MIETDEIIDCLNKLIQTCKDGQEGFETAAKEAKRPDLKTLFTQFASERRQCASELQTLVAQYGGEYKEGGSFLGGLHRGWIDAKAALTGHDDAGIINECERGEDAAINTYQDIMKKPLPAEVMTIISREYDKVKSAHDKVRSMQLQESNR